MVMQEQNQDATTVELLKKLLIVDDDEVFRQRLA